MSSDQLLHFTDLKGKIYEAAANALAAANPDYVETFRRRMQETEGNLDLVIGETKPLLGQELKGWADVLTAILDVELVLDQMKRSLTYLASDVVGTPEENGAWVNYHADHWVFETDAFLKRLAKLVAAIFRRLVRPRDDDWRAKERAVRDDIEKMKVEIAKVRNPLAHGLGGGVIGIQEERLWEPFLAAQVFDVDLVASRNQRSGQYRQRWHSYLYQTTILVVAELEAISKRLCEYVT